MASITCTGSASEYNPNDSIFVVVVLDSSKDSSLQSDTSIESEDSFASVIYVPRPEQTASTTATNGDLTHNIIRIPSVPTSPLVMPCPTPAHSPAPQRIKLGAVIEETSKFIFETESATVMTTNGGKQSKTALHPAKSQTTGKITKYDVKNMPIIPKFRKANSCHSSTRSNRFAVPAVPKFTSLELYNPETDDIDSDSDEPSSPDSIDSVINALQPTAGDESTANGAKTSTNADQTEDAIANAVDTAEAELLEICLPPDEDATDTHLTADDSDRNSVNSMESQQQLVDFAEQLSAQLLKELNKDAEAEKNHANGASHGNNGGNGSNTVSSKLDGPITINLDESCFIKRLNSEHRNLSTLREELRERRLMLANLKSHNYPNSSNSTSSTIHEEDEISPTQTSQHELEFDNFVSQNDYDADREQYAAAKCVGGRMAHNLIVNMDDNLELCNDSDSLGEGSNGATNTSSLADVAAAGVPVIATTADARCHSRTMESRRTADSWTHSNSTVSLDSPSAGGASTHHRYYHVFREGELDSLINHHVASLHIVSSYYERASWCVVAEKVQVWTI